MIKRTFLGLLLFMVSTYTLAASVTINNAVFSEPRLFSGSDSNLFYQMGDLGDEYAVSSDAFNYLDPFRVEVDIETLVSGTLTFDLGTSALNWAYSLVNSVTEEVVSAGSWTANIFIPSAGVLTEQSALVEAKAVYKLIIEGDKYEDNVDNRSFDMAMSNIELSEVPLPAAVWLFGSVLLGGLALRRKKRLAIAA